MSRRTVDISIFVKCRRNGLENNYFGKIEINEKEFNFNFSVSNPDNLFGKRSAEEYLKFLESVDLSLFNKNYQEIDLNKEEYRFFVSMLIISLKKAPDKYKFQMHLLAKMPREEIVFLVREKFDCQIDN